ncbi:MAG: LPS export ABC transporter permease LptF [Gammaproteobacteria bacterium]|nr:LPS export ABC transporter permease LptF [Gammaproteobacteria bacterium]
MLILERYIYREILSKLGWILMFLVLILSSDRFVDYLSDAAAGALPNHLIFKILIMKMLTMLPQLLPIVLFLGVLLALSRLSLDRELIIVSGSGLTERFKLFSIMKLSMGFSLLVFITSFFISPWAEGQFREIRNQAALEADISGIAAGRFREFSKGDMVVYVEKMDEENESMKNIFLHRKSDENIGVLNSASARYFVKPDSGSRYVLFENGNRYVGQPGDREYQITKYKTYGVLLDYGEVESEDVWLNTYPTSQIWQDTRPQYQAEFQWRLSFVFATLLLPAFALVINRYFGSDSRYIPVFICGLGYLIYSNLLGLSKSMLYWDRIPGYLGLWWVHFIFLIVIVLLFNGPSIWRWLKPVKA